MTFNKWLVNYKYFNSKTHFNNYIKGLNLSKNVEADVINYFKDMYNSFISEYKLNGGR